MASVIVLGPIFTKYIWASLLNYLEQVCVIDEEGVNSVSKDSTSNKRLFALKRLLSDVNHFVRK